MVTLDSIDIQHLTPQKLGELLIEAKKAYYTGGKPIMDDHTYDTLEDLLLKKNPYHRIFSKVGSANFNTGFDKKKHIMPMGSLNKVSKYEDLVHYFELKKITDTAFVTQPKCDGISLEIIYQNGKLTQAITRGDGRVGDVITQNVVKMKNCVLNLPNRLSCSVRCEIIVTKKDFQKLNAVTTQQLAGKKHTLTDDNLSSLTDAYSNPRNAASGLSQRLDGQYADYCSLYAVSIYPSQTTEMDAIRFLKSLGFTPVNTVLCHNLKDVETLYQQFLHHDRLHYPYDIDGLVIKINQLHLQQQLGTKNNRPHGQVAYKFPASSNTTVIKSVTWQVGPLGTITPVAQVEPIELSGAIVQYASLANTSLIKEKNFNIDDIVQISRRGDVIPHIDQVITKVNPGHVDIPTSCPSCHTVLIQSDKFLRCPNQAKCPAQILGSLRLFCDTLGILGLSDKTIDKLYRAKHIRLPGDFYQLKPQDIQDLDNLGEKSANNIIKQIQAKKTLSLVEIFDSAIIPNFSSQRIYQVIQAGFDSPEQLLNISQTELESLPGFQTTLARKVWQGIQLRRPWIESILSQVTLMKPSSTTTNLPLFNLTFCITGDLSKPRPIIIDLIQSLGGNIHSTVSKNTSYLLTNETTSTSSKFITAQKLNIPIINETQLHQLISSRS